MIPYRSAELLGLLVSHRLLSEQQLGEAAPLAGSAFDAKSFASLLLQRSLLTPFQANHLLQGKAEALVFNDYVLLDRLGEGGMGKVYRARHRGRNGLVAIKVLKPGALETEQLALRFEREIQAAAQVQHENIVLAIDAGTVNGTPYFVMEYLPGIDLMELVEEQGPLPVPLACFFAHQIALGLQHIHERGLVHRDIKPKNVMVGPRAGGALDVNDPASFGPVKILDLGLAILRTPDSRKTLLRLTRIGAAMGTPDFMAPEQTLDAHAVDIRADIYSLGCALYFLLTGRVPFAGGSAAQKVFQHRQLPPPEVRRHRPQTPADLAALLKRMMAKRAEDRPALPGAVAEELLAFCGIPLPPVRAAAPPPVPPPPPPPPPPAAEPEAGLPRKRFTPSGFFPQPPVREPSLRRRVASPPTLEWVAAACPECGGVLELLPGVQASSATCPQCQANRSRFPPGPVLVWMSGPLPLGPFAFAQVILLNHLRRATSGGSLADSMAETTSFLDGQQIRVWGLGDSDAQTYCLLVSRDGLRLASGGRTLKVFDLGPGGTEFSLKGHGGAVFCLALSADGRRLYSGSQDQSIRAWDLDTGKETQCLRGHGGPVLALTLSADGRWLFSGGEDTHLRRWNLETGHEEQVLPTGPIHCLALSPDGGRLYTGGADHALRIWDLGTGREEHCLRGHAGPISCLTGGGDGQRLFSGGDDQTIRVWDPRSGQERFCLRGHTQPVNALVLSNDGRRLFSGSYDQTIKAWDPRTGTAIT